ncbi:chitin binding peritrophin-A domain-containing protein [Streptomyces sp. NPDC053542]|uniref:chitin binding peritrophin-A domain-containing protein n=1 Tax=Streptomyces sp. NPDC053542 TaxID=3365710 RepID=UPI0037D990CC
MKITRALAALGLTVAACVLPSQAASADPITECAGNPPGESLLEPYPDDPRWFIHCDGRRAYVKECPAGLVWSAVPQRCEWPENAGVQLPVDYALTAGTARLDGASRTVRNLSATLDPGLKGEKITFTTADGTVLCTAITHTVQGDNAKGPSMAKCDSRPGLLLPVDALLRGYRANYAGNTVSDVPLAEPGSAIGAVRLL